MIKTIAEWTNHYNAIYVAYGSYMKLDCWVDTAKCQSENCSKYINCLHFRRLFHVFKLEFKNFKWYVNLKYMETYIECFYFVFAVIMWIGHQDQFIMFDIVTFSLAMSVLTHLSDNLFRFSLNNSCRFKHPV